MRAQHGAHNAVSCVCVCHVMGLRRTPWPQRLGAPSQCGPVLPRGQHTNCCGGCACRAPPYGVCAPHATGAGGSAVAVWVPRPRGAHAWRRRRAGHRQLTPPPGASRKQAPHAKRCAHRAAGATVMAAVWREAVYPPGVWGAGRLVGGKARTNNARAPSLAHDPHRTGSVLGSQGQRRLGAPRASQKHTALQHTAPANLRAWMCPLCRGCLRAFGMVRGEGAGPESGLARKVKTGSERPAPFQDQRYLPFPPRHGM